MAALRVYRSLLRLAGTMPEAKRAAVVAQAREELAFFRELRDEQEIEKRLELFESKVAFLRMQTPKLGLAQRGRSRIVYRRDGTKDEGRGTPRDKARVTNCDGSNMDPDSVTRHYHGLKRAGFTSNAHAKGIF